MNVNNCDQYLGYEITFGFIFLLQYLIAFLAEKFLP